ncbi:MAG: hypothetical protein EPN62_08775 [Candidimonas sp.]|nr:MAG: hypothetical protein EPN77_06010 [Candidimonas sp.]TAM23760.1 MAG: hypothetical protein EPN62_08775 [Candidimonas sp.]
MTTSVQLRDMVVAALVGKTDVGALVYSPRSWPTQDRQYPYLMVQVPDETKDSLGRTAPQFNVVATIRILARVQFPGQVNDQASAKTEAALEQIKAQIEVAVINSPTLTQSIQQFLSVHSTIRIDSNGATYLGELVMDFQLEFYQGPEDFYPVDAVPLEDVDIRADLVNVDDPTGTYPNPDFPQSVTPAPRTAGPDGRNEGHVVINPQEI